MTQRESSMDANSSAERENVWAHGESNLHLFGILQAAYLKHPIEVCFG